MLKELPKAEELSTITPILATKRQGVSRVGTPHKGAVSLEKHYHHGGGTAEVINSEAIVYI
jgi:hypothetical protein